MKNNQPVTQREVDYGDSDIFVTRTDLKGIITYANDTFVNISGFSKEELIGKNHNIVRHPDMPTWAFDDLWKTVKGGHPWKGIVKNRCKNGDHYWVSATVVPITRNGEVIGYLSLRRKPSKKEVSDAELLYKSGNPTIRRFSISKWYSNLPMQVKIQPVLLIVLVGATIAIYFQMRSSIMENVQRRAESTAMQVIDSANILMVTGTISDANNRQLMIKKIIEGQRLKSLRLIRTQQVVSQYGPGLPEEQLDDSLVKQIIENSEKAGKSIPYFSLNYSNGKPIFRAITPYIESHNFHGTDCLICHQVKEGSSNGASDLTIDLSGEFNHLNLIIAYLVAGQLALQIFLYFFLKRITQEYHVKPVEEVKRHLLEVVDGNFSRPVDISRRDEMGELLCSVQSTKILIGAIIDQIGSTASEIDIRSANLSEAVSAASNSAHVQAESSHKMATNIEEISDSIDHVAGNAEELRRISTESSNTATKGGETVRQVVADMALIGNEVSAAAEAVKNLGERSNEIKGIIKVIQDIADQTNLLALNAAIEAARAGEQGRGFAVVADEVRKLAEKTSTSTRQITATIEGINAGTEKAINMIGAAVEKARDGEVLAEKAGGAIVEIGKGAEKVRAGVDNISSTIKEQSIASREIADNVEKIAQMSEENSQAIHQVDETAKVLEKLSIDLKQVVGNFRV